MTEATQQEKDFIQGMIDASYGEPAKENSSSEYSEGYKAIKDQDNG